VLGALAAGLFQAAELSQVFFRLRGGLNLIGGVLMVLVGLILLRVLPLPSSVSRAAAAPVAWFGGTFPRLIRSRSISSKLLLGLAVGLLPCCLLWAMVLTAAATQDPARGALVMIMFGLGTMPALVAAGAFALFFPARVRFLGERLAAVSVTIAGLVMVLNGAGIFG
jgi:sulfite exporter TauE/SafE